MKKPDLEKQQGKKVAPGALSRGGHGAAVSKREQALARKRELLEKSRKTS